MDMIQAYIQFLHFVHSLHVLIIVDSARCWPCAPADGIACCFDIVTHVGDEHCVKREGVEGVQFTKNEGNVDEGGR